MIITICRELGIDPKEMVRGLGFFEPFFDTIVTSRVVKIRYRIGARSSKEQSVTGEALHYHVELGHDVDVYAVEVVDSTFEPRYYKGEKLIIAAVEPVIGDEAFCIGEDGTAYLWRVISDTEGACMKNVGRGESAPTFPLEKYETTAQFVHKVIGMTR